MVSLNMQSHLCEAGFPSSVFKILRNTFSVLKLFNFKYNYNNLLSNFNMN